MRRTFVAATAAALVLAGCSGSTDTASPTGTESTSSDSSTTSSSSASSSSTSSASSSTKATKKPTKNASSSPRTVPKPTGYSKPEQPAKVTKDACLPQRINLPKVAIDQTVASMGVNSQGQINPPAKTTMWYNKSPLPGANGIAVIAAHVEYNGPDNFYRLDESDVGDTVTVTCANGSVQKWKVSAKEAVNKVDLQSDARVWGSSDSPVIAFVTCDRSSEVVDQHLADNYVVWARPA